MTLSIFLVKGRGRELLDIIVALFEQRLGHRFLKLKNFSFMPEIMNSFHWISKKGQSVAKAVALTFKCVKTICSTYVPTIDSYKR